MKLGEDRINEILAKAPAPRGPLPVLSERAYTYEVARDLGKAQTESRPGRRTVIIVAKHFAERP